SLPVLHQGSLDDRHFLVFRRCLDDASQVTAYLVFAPLATPLPTIVRAIGGRWHIEEDLQAAKALGLDHYEVRSYLGWYRHITLVLLARAFLVSLSLQQHPLAPLPRPSRVLFPLAMSQRLHLTSPPSRPRPHPLSSRSPPRKSVT